MKLKNDKVVYIYRDEIGLPFYVGSGTMSRAYETYKARRSPEFIQKIQEIQNKTGFPCYPEIVAKYLTRTEALALESKLIKEHNLESLVNTYSV